MNNQFDYESIAKEAVDCPLCGSGEHSLVYNRDRYDMGIHTVICKRCGFVFTNPRPTEAALADFYRHHYRKYYENTETPTDEYLEKGRFTERAMWNLEFIQADLDKELGRRGKVRFLDVGCAQGSLLRLLKDRYRETIALAGIEPSLEFSKYASEHSGAEIYTGVLEGYLEVNKERECFDYINLSHVLEHILQPVRFLRNLHDLLRPEGRLCVEIPNILGEWYGVGMFHIGHVSQFCPETFARAARLAGFSIISRNLVGNEIHPWKMTFLMQRMVDPSPDSIPKTEEIATWRSEIVRRTESSILQRIGRRLERVWM